MELMMFYQVDATAAAHVAPNRPKGNCKNPYTASSRLTEQANLKTLNFPELSAPGSVEALP